MDWNVVISQNENLNEVYEELGKELETYIANMRSKVSNVGDIVDALANGWSGDMYQAFKKDMQKAMDEINSCLDRGQGLRDQVKVIQERIANALEILRTKYGS